MEELISEVLNCVSNEYGRASAKFGPTNNSDHESYAIMLEEFEESQDEMHHLKDEMTAFWNSIKLNSSDKVKLYECNTMERTAILAACEMIQVAAMARKAAITISSKPLEGSV